MPFPPSNELERLLARRDELSAAATQADGFYQAKAAEMREVRAQLAAVNLDVDVNLRAALYDRQRILADTVSAAMIKANALRRQLADLDDGIDKVKAKVRSLDRSLASKRVELGPDGYYTALVEEARARLEQAQNARRKAEAEVEVLLKDRRLLAPDDFDP